ncbi:hydrophobin, partial [Sparassis latifolia]
PASQCNTGSIQCCDSLQDSSSPQAQNILSSLGLPLADAANLVGIGCTAGLVGVGGDTCVSAPVCCEDNSFQGLINLGCVPIIISL